MVVRAERHLRRTARGEGERRRPDVAAGGVATEQIRRVERHPDRLRQLTLGTVGRHARDLGVLQVGADLGAAGHAHQLAQRHPLPPGEPAGLVHRAADHHEVRAVERRDGIHHHRVAVLEGKRGHRHTADGLAAMSSVRGPRRVLGCRRRDRQGDVHHRPRERAGPADRGG